MELLAQVVEEVSILAAERRRNEPVKVPRPKHLRKGGSTKAERWGGASTSPATPAATPQGPDPSYGAAMSMLAGSGGARIKVRSGTGE